MIKNEPLMKSNLLHRASLRGLKKCTSCGYINGQRALICHNVSCDLRVRRLAAIKPFDPIQLVTNGHIKIFSLRSKEKLLQPRSFVSITENEESNITRPCAVCYVDNCKYDTTEPTHLVCRHIKACKVLTNVAVAEIYPIDTRILWSLNIPVDQKQRLWELYQREEMLIQPVQKLNSSIFVVKCQESNIFPVGRLHIIISTSKVPSKNGNFLCSCKKLKIMLEPDNSVIMRQEICDHVLLLLAAILTKTDGKKLYSKFLELLQHLWMPTILSKSVNYDITSTELMGNGLQLEKCFEPNMKNSIAEAGDSKDIFNFDEELFVENNMPDFYDIILGSSVDKDTTAPKLDTTDQVNPEKCAKDPKLNALESIVKDEEMELSLQPFNSPNSMTCLDEGITQTPLHFNENNLSVIEQFQLNHNVQIPNDNIELAKDIESLNNMESSLVETNTGILPSISNHKSLLKTYSMCNSQIENPRTKSCITVNCMKSPTTLPTQKSIVLKQGPVKILKIGTPLMLSPIQQCSKIVQIMKISPKKVMVLKSKQNEEVEKQNVSHLEEALQSLKPQPNLIDGKETNIKTLPTLTYEYWMDHIIEVINESVVIKDPPSVQNTFNVPRNFFTCLSKTFISSNTAKILPKTLVVKNGKYKNHVKYCWHFSQASAVQQIFTSRNGAIELERLYKRLPDNNYELFSPTKIKYTDNQCFRTIYPKIQLYKAFIKFPNHSDNLRPDKCSFRLEWLPTAFPKSNFGLMSIEFCVSVKELDGTN